MIDFPIAKINLGLNIVGRRSDGYHNLETVFYPVPICDVLEATPMDEAFPSAACCDIKVTNAAIDCADEDNLVVKAYNLLRTGHSLPRLHVHLFKRIPMQAGMGGGSSDCAFMIRMLNREFGLGLTQRQMADMASRLGADCPFFIYGAPAYAEGIGERLSPVALDLSGWWLAVVCPHIPVSTKEAFAHVEVKPTATKCRDIVAQPVETWRGRLTNDFERSVFRLHPEIGVIKQRLYDAGAAYASMTGSGSSVFGLFIDEPRLDFGQVPVHVLKL